MNRHAALGGALILAGLALLLLVGCTTPATVSDLGPAPHCWAVNRERVCTKDAPAGPRSGFTVERCACGNLLGEGK